MRHYRSVDSQPAHRLAGAGQALLAVATGAVIALAGAAPAGAAGFGQPTIVSGKDDASAPLLAIAPNGRTALTYTRTITRNHRWVEETRFAIGPSPDRLGKPRTLTAFPASARGSSLAPLARPDGGFTVCSVGRFSCALAAPDGGFGPAIRLSYPIKNTFSNTALAVGPDSRTWMAISTRPTLKDGTLGPAVTVLASLAADGTPGAPITVDNTGGEPAIYGGGQPLAVLNDGTVALAVDVPGKRSTEVHPGVRLLAPGATTFGPVIRLSTEARDGYLELHGGGALTVEYQTSSVSYDQIDYTERFVRQQPGGGFGAVEGLAGMRPHEAATTLLPLAAGGPLAVTSEITTRDGDSDCFDPQTGRVRAARLATSSGMQPTPQRLSAKGQIARWPRAAQLADGTVIASWEDAAGYSGATRLEVAIRPAGADARFAAPQVLPRLSDGDGARLAAAGTSAALTWSTPATRSRRGVVVSSLQAAGPYARQAARPAHPAAPCDE